jgi:hypothetical protein
MRFLIYLSMVFWIALTIVSTVDLGATVLCQNPSRLIDRPTFCRLDRSASVR